MIGWWLFLRRWLVGGYSWQQWQQQETDTVQHPQGEGEGERAREREQEREKERDGESWIKSENCFGLLLKKETSEDCSICQAASLAFARRPELEWLPRGGARVAAEDVSIPVRRPTAFSRSLRMHSLRQAATEAFHRLGEHVTQPQQHHAGGTEQQLTCIAFPSVFMTSVYYPRVIK